MLNSLFNYLVKVREARTYYSHAHTRWQKVCGRLLTTLFTYRYELRVRSEQWERREAFLRNEHKKLGVKFSAVVEEYASSLDSKGFAVLNDPPEKARYTGDVIGSEDNGYLDAPDESIQ
jgi:hypothetical protein